MTKTLSLLMVLLVAAIFAAPALAQTTAPAPAGIDTTSLRATLGTITGIAALALFVVQAVKWTLAKYKIGILSELPTPIFVAAVAMGLTVLASLVFKTLPGDTIDLVWQAMFAAAGSSAVFSWLKNGMDGPAQKVSRAILPFLLPLVLMGGCAGMSNGQKYILATQTYATTANTVAALVRAGEFGTAEKAKIRAVNDTCLVLIMEMRDDLLQDTTPFDFQYTLRQFQTVLDELLRMQLVAEAAKTKEISHGPDNPSIDRTYGGTEHGLAAGEGGLRVPADRPTADPGGVGCGDTGSDGRARESGRRPERASPALASPRPGAFVGFADYEFD